MVSIYANSNEREVLKAYIGNTEEPIEVLVPKENTILIYFVQDNGTYGIPYIAEIDRKNGLIMQVISLNLTSHRLIFSENIVDFRKYFSLIEK